MRSRAASRSPQFSSSAVEYSICEYLVTITEIIGAVQTAMGAKAMEAGITSMISDAIKHHAIELATSALAPIKNKIAQFRAK
jgi:hypothetical protein